MFSSAVVCGRWIGSVDSGSPLANCCADDRYTCGFSAQLGVVASVHYSHGGCVATTAKVRLKMKVKSVKAKRFKRFTDLAINGIPAGAKLVCLVGPNGSGKSSLFEVFNYCIPASKSAGSFHLTADYHIKVSDEKIDSSNWSTLWGSGFQNVDVHFHDAPPISVGTRSLKSESFYIRTSYRHEADVEVANLKRLDDVIADQNRPKELISVDRRVSGDYMRIVSDSIAAIYEKEFPDSTTKGEIRDRLVGKARAALSQLFPDLIFEGVGIRWSTVRSISRRANLATGSTKIYLPEKKPRSICFWILRSKPKPSLTQYSA